MRITVVTLLLLSACAPSLRTSNEAGGLVSVRGSLNGQTKAMKIADESCRKFGKVAKYESTNEFRGTVKYACVAP